MDPTLILKPQFSFSFSFFGGLEGFGVFLFFETFFPYIFWCQKGKTVLDHAKDQNIVELIIQLKVSFFLIFSSFFFCLKLNNN